ncbi:MAG: hypothetical protein QOH76_3661 [Thermoleophilaceae bacterium]|nr:hypothetical protein [Thermoleophilaceae bacterium]
MTRLLEIDAEQFATSFAREPFTVRHGLTEHPLLSVESLAQLADRVPSGSVEHNRGDVPEVLSSGEAPREDLSPGEIARGIETNGCWMVLKHIEQDPEYKQLLDETLDEVAPLVNDREGGMHRREGFIFLSAPNSVTPSHIDPEHNFLLQVRGWKEMNVGRFGDPKAEQELLERYYSGGHRNLEWKPEDATTYRLDPGHGIYVPVHAPHFVRNGDSVSVSLSITWFTPSIERDARVHALNARLRKLGISPLAPGRRAASDHAKASAAKALAAARRTVRGRRAA